MNDRIPLLTVLKHYISFISGVFLTFLVLNRSITATYVQYETTINKLTIQTFATFALLSLSLAYLIYIYSNIIFSTKKSA